MIKIPNENRFVQPNSSDLNGNIWYTKNINFDEEGYLNLSSRAFSIATQKTTGNVALPLAFGRATLFTATDSTDWAVTQNAQKGYWLSLSEESIAVNIDVGINAPTLSADSHGVWYNNLWAVTSDTDFWTKEGIGDSQTYTDRGNLTTSKVHPMCVNENQNYLCVGNGNFVNQYNSSYVDQTDFKLELPSHFEVVALAYSNFHIGVATMLNDSTDSLNQNTEARFFVWEGNSTRAQYSIPVGSDMIIGVTPYMGSFALLTRAGQLLMWNGGGGFQVLASLPFYYVDKLHAKSYQREMFGDFMKAEGDVIYINWTGILNAFGLKYEAVLPNNPGGILCYDPKVGIYHRYSPSISPGYLIEVLTGGVNTTTDIITANSGTVPTTGNQIKYLTRTDLIGGLTSPKIYYVIRHTSTTFSLAETYDDAVDGNKVNLTSQSSDSSYFLGLEHYDYGQSITTKSGAVALVGKINGIQDHLIFGSELNDYETTGDYYHWNQTVAGFDNVGYFVTPKITTDNLEDVLQKINQAYRPLKENDSIILKYKGREYLNLPISTPQLRTSTRNQCSWTSSTVFTTTADISSAKTAFDAGVELECEIIAGAGGGSMEKITDLTESSGTYTVTLENAVLGAGASRYCDVIIDNWTYLGEITSEDTDNYKNISAIDGFTSSWFKLKFILKGSDVSMYLSKIINAIHMES